MKASKVKKEFVLVKLADLKPHPKNPKDHDIEGIKASIIHNGALDPIEVDEKNVILAGHGRCEAEIELGIVEDYVIRYTGLTDVQKEDYVLRANTTTMSRGFLDDKLKLFKKETLSGAGFTGNDMDRIFGAVEDLEDDFNPDKEYGGIKKPETKPGDLYILGKHRLLCGDATKAEDYERVLDGKKADLIFTDPPYNVNYKGRSGEGIKNDHMEADAFMEFTQAFTDRFAEALKKGGVFYICSGYSSYPMFRFAIEKAKMTFSCPIVWVKNQPILGWGDYRRQYELILKGGGRWSAKARTRRAGTLWLERRQAFLCRRPRRGGCMGLPQTRGRHHGAPDAEADRAHKQGYQKQQQARGIGTRPVRRIRKHAHRSGTNGPAISTHRTGSEILRHHRPPVGKYHRPSGTTL